MDKWGLYELLKGNRAIGSEVIQLVEEMDKVELREGVLEYLMLLKQNKSPPLVRGASYMGSGRG